MNTLAKNNFKIVVDNTEKKKKKYKKDGTVKKSGGDKKSGNASTVYPIKNPEEFKQFYEYWQHKINEVYTPYKKFTCARNHLLITIGCNSAYRISDIVTLKWKDILVDGSIRRKEKKTRKYRTVFMNDMVDKAVEFYLEVTGKTIDDLDMEEYVFTTCKSDHMTPENALSFIKDMAKDIGIKENVGTHTLRKNFVYWTLVTHKDDVNILYRVMELMNHSSPRMTFAYATITQDESKQLFMDVGETYKNILNGVFSSMHQNIVRISKDGIIELITYAYETALKDADNKDKSIHLDNLSVLQDMLNEYIL